MKQGVRQNAREEGIESEDEITVSRSRGMAPFS
jgi:hypothetical protein